MAEDVKAVAVVRSELALAAKVLRDVGGQSAIAVTVEAGVQAIDALRAERDAAIRGEHRTDDTQPTWAELVTYWRGRAQRAEAQAAELAQALAEMLELRTASIECRIMDRHELDIVRDARAALSRAANDTQAGGGGA